MIKEKSQIGRRFIALTVLLALLFASAVSAAPQFHRWLHGAGSHECAVTLISSGNCELVSTVVFVAPVPSQRATVLLPGISRALPHALEFARLEHAPPALS